MLFVPLSIKSALLMNFIPLAVVVITQIVSYRAIKKSAEQFNFNEARVKTMKRIRKTFIRVAILFFTLVTPASTTLIFLYYTYIFHRDFFELHCELPLKLYPFFNLLLAVNSIVNPFIYAKIQKRFRLCEHFRQCLQVLQNIRQSDQVRRIIDNQQGQDTIELGQPTTLIKVDCDFQ